MSKVAVIVDANAGKSWMPMQGDLMRLGIQDSLRKNKRHKTNMQGYYPVANQGQLKLEIYHVTIQVSLKFRFVCVC